MLILENKRNVNDFVLYLYIIKGIMIAILINTNILNLN